MHLKKLAFGFLLAAASLAGAQTGIVLDASHYFFDPNYDYTPVSLAISGRNEYVAVSTTKSAGGAPGAAILSVLTGQRQAITQYANIIDNLQPTAFVNNVPEDDFSNYDVGPAFSIAGNQTTAKGTKVEYFGGGSGNVIGGDLDFEYTGDGKDVDQTLAIGPYPYAGYVASSIGSGSELTIFKTTAGATNPSVELDDKDINPAMSAFSGNLILAAGADRVAASPYAARASAYTINANGTVSLAFTKTFSNTLSNHIFTKHVLKWGALSPDFNVLVDNITVTNASNPNLIATSYSYILRAYNGSGTLLWTSPSGSGLVAQISAGSTSLIYVLTSLAPGQFLTAYGEKGTPIWQQSSNASVICACLSQGVVYAVNEPNGVGKHPHVTVVKLSADGTEEYSVDYVSQSANNDIATNLVWINGFLYVAGQCENPQGQKGIFGAHWHQT